MSNVVKVLEIFSNPKNVKDSFCAVRHSENTFKRHKITRPCLDKDVDLECDSCAFYKDTQKAVSTIVKENSIHE